MCDALRELFADELEAREVRGLEQGLERGLERGLEQGIERGIADSILELLAELGQVPDSLKNIVYTQSDPVMLKTWLKLAAKAETFDAFQKALQTK